MVADDELGRAAADVDDQRALVGQVVGGAGIGGRRLLVAGEHFGLDAKQAAHPVEELLTVGGVPGDRKSTRLNSSHRTISYAVFCLKKKKVYSGLGFLQTRKNLTIEMGV